MSDELKEQIVYQVTEVALRLKDPEEYRKKFRNNFTTNKILNSSVYELNAPHLANGIPGFCQLFGELDNFHPGKGWEYIGHNYLLEIQRIVENIRVGPSLWYGLSGVGLAIKALSKNGERYSNFTKQLNNLIVEQVNQFIDYIHSNSNKLAVNHFDVASGLSGIARYLLFFSNQPEIRKCLLSSLEYFISISKDINILDYNVPGWYISPDNLMNDSERKLYANGNFNFGVAHGIIGPLSLLSLALLQGIEVIGQKEAIKDIANNTLRWKYDNGNVDIWPRTVSLEEMIRGEYSNKPTSFDGWCYGTPGSARAIWLAGVALGNQFFKEEALKSFIRLFNRREDQTNLISPTFCHGLAGVLQVYNRMYQETGAEEFWLMTNEVTRRILGFFDGKLTFCYSNIDKLKSGVQEFSYAGLVNGAVGISLSLLGLINNSDNEWDAAFLIS